MSHHLNDEKLSGHIHHTLTDAEREAIDQHLTTCPTCRAHLDDHGGLQRRIRYDLSADLRLTFAEAEGDEAVGRIVGRDAHLDAIAWDHPDAEAAHPPGELCRHGLAALENDPVAAAAEDLLDGPGRLDQIVSRQIVSPRLARSAAG